MNKINDKYFRFMILKGIVVNDDTLPAVFLAKIVEGSAGY
jgi:hypothetical protein